MENPLISVVVPMYNRETTIERCLLSITNQTYKNLEIIVVDDGSLDNSITVAQMVAEKDSRIKLYALETNSGAAVARNFGIQQVQGEYLAFLDSDDAWRPQKIEKQWKKLQEKGADVVFSAFITNIGDKQVKWPLGTEGYISLNTLLGGNVVSPTTVLGKSDIWKENLFDCNLAMYEDWIQMLDVLEQGYKVYFFDEIVTDVYRQSNSVSNNALKIASSAKYIMQRYQNKKEMKEHLHSTLTRELLQLGIIKTKSEKEKKRDALLEKEKEVEKLLSQGELLQIETVLGQETELTSNLKIIKELIKIFKVEVQNNVALSVFDYSVDFTTVIKHYKTVKALIRRVETGLPYEQQRALYLYCKENGVSAYVIGAIILTNAYDRKNVCEQVMKLWEKEEPMSEYISYFMAVRNYLEDK